MIDHDFLWWDAGEAEDAEGVTPFPPAPRPVPGDSDPRRLLDVVARRARCQQRCGRQCRLETPPTIGVAIRLIAAVWSPRELPARRHAAREEASDNGGSREQCRSGFFAGLSEVVGQIGV